MGLINLMGKKSVSLGSKIKAIQTHEKNVGKKVNLALAQRNSEINFHLSFEVEILVLFYFSFSFIYGTFIPTFFLFLLYLC